ncbi:MAG: hypothetical protein JO113_04380, partial [Candidatus Eremiobacteraeota bacterium]|nr:hypothetical protein [Candidatus Eremiobacteraeota bacterium]
MSALDSKPIGDLASAVTGLKATIPPLTTLESLLHPGPIPIPAKPPVQTTVLRAGKTIGYIVTPGGDPAPTGLSVALSAGTLWLAPAQLGSSFASSTGWVGIPFASARLTASGTVTFSGGQIAIDAAATLTIAVTSAVETTTGPAGDPIGVDFLNAKLTPFPQGTIALAPTAATIEVGGAASATIYGQTVNATPQAGAEPVLVTLGLPFVAVPCTVPPGTFTASSSASLELTVAGSAPLVEAGLLFPILDATPGAFPDPVDAWGLSLAVGGGLTARFGTLVAAVPLGGAIIALTGAQLLGVLVIGATGATDRYMLWVSPAPPNPPPPTQPQLAFPPAQLTMSLGAGALLDYKLTPLVGFHLTPAQEMIEELGLLSAFLDRPIAADGSRIAIGGLALAVRARTATRVLLEIASALTPDPSAMLALMAENAFVPVAAPNGFVLSGTLQNNSVSGALEVTFPTTVIIPTLPDPYAALYVAPP